MPPLRDQVPEPVCLHVALATARGGAEVVVESIMAGAAAQPAVRYRHMAVVPEGSALVSRWRTAGLTVLECPPLPRFRDVAAARRLIGALARTMSSVDAAIVHTHAIAGQVFGARAARRVRRPVVWHLHDVRQSRWTSDGILHRLAARAHATVAVAVSHAVADSWRDSLGPARIHVVHNGVSADRVAPAARPDAPCVVWCGRLQRWKGTHVFLDVAAAVHRQLPDTRLVVVGGTLFGLDPDYPDELRRQADRLGLASVLHWVGQVDDARPWLASGDVVVHSSVEPEPFGLVVAEAMMQARAVVAFRQGGPAEMIVDGQSGRLLPAGDVDAMAEAVVGLLRQRELRNALGAGARARALDQFSVPAMVQGVESAYDRARTEYGS